jgi:hypothetical protein
MMDTHQRTSDRGLTLGYVLVMGVITALYRLAPYYLLGDPTQVHPLWNMAAVGGLALFAGSRVRERWAFLVPLGAMFFSDLLLIQPLRALGLSVFSWGTPIIYASFLLYVLMGRLICESELSGMVIGGAALLGSLQFFLITNFAVWLSSNSHPRTLGGLLECYLRAVPFYRGTLMGDLLCSGLIFGVHAVLVRTKAAASLETAT